MTGGRATPGTRRGRGAERTEISFLYSTFRPQASDEAFQHALGVCGYLRPPFTAFWAHSKMLDAVMMNRNGECETHSERRAMVYAYVDDRGLRVSEYDDFGLCGHFQLVFACFFS
jgi:hypothetical protein